MFGYDNDKEELEFIDWLTNWLIVWSIIVFFLLYFVVPSPWGKTLDSNKHWFLGPLLPARPSWIVFESPNLAWCIVSWHHRRKNVAGANVFLVLLFFIHYVRRAIIYPLQMSKKSRPIPLVTALSAFSFCCMNGYLQTRPLLSFVQFETDFRFYLQFTFGILLFILGFYINYNSDQILRKLRHNKSNDKKKSDNNNQHSYYIPTGGLFEYVSTPHYFGEILEWIGFAIATQNQRTAWAFVLVTAANLIPRGVAHHQWYRNQPAEFFSNKSEKYPSNRKAVIPFVW